MSAFENFIQLELPKRPYLNIDAPQETIMVRRGVGPRQLQPVSLSEGQVLTFLNGQLIGSSIATLSGFQKMVVPIDTPAAVWNISHPFNTRDAILQVTDENGFVIFANSMQIIDESNIQISFLNEQRGTLRLIFFT